MFEQLGLIGCGLMGGSFALALKRAGWVQRVVGYSKSPSTTARALQLGVIDVEAPSALLAVSGADIVLLAVPVAATEDTLRAIRHMVSETTLVMDVGSTKADVVAAAERALREQVSSFVPAHPIAGKECAGVEHADAALYQGCKVILTPTALTRARQVEQAQALWRALGAQVITLTPQAHDAAFAVVSHLPHLLAFAMMNTVLAQPNAAQLLALAGPGFRDFTRIAAGEPSVWRDIFLANRTELLAQCGQLQAQLQSLESLLRAGDPQALYDAIARASAARAGWQLNTSSAHAQD
ncbi:MAG: prephenate dehydrogenase/arogenate dehydrogenase family protein [Rhodoferax sp.]